MSKNENNPNWNAKIIAHAWKDPNFKRKLLSHPQEALKEIGCPISEKLHITVIEEKENHMTLVIPPSPQNTGTLSEAELIEMAGGKTGTWIIYSKNQGC